MFNSKRSADKKTPDGDSYKTTVDNNEVDIRSWADQLIKRGIDDRNKVVSAKEGYLIATKNFIDRIKQNFGLFRDLYTEFSKDREMSGIAPSNIYINNSIRDKIRAKLAILLGNTVAWKYEEFDVEDSDEVFELNQILRQRLEVEGFDESRLEAKIKKCIYGSEITGYLHDMSIDEPEGGSYFECLDPLACLWEHGKQYINHRSPSKQTKYFIVVRLREVGRIEREYGKKIATGNSLVNVSDFSVIHAIDNFILDKPKHNKVPEIQIWYHDETTEAVKEKIPKLVPVIIEETGEPELDVDGNVVMQAVFDENGDQVFDEVKTNTDKMVYPNGRLIVIAEKTIMYDDVNPYGHGMIPYEKEDNITDGVNFWGISDVEVGLSHERAINRINNDILNNISQFGGIVAINESANSANKGVGLIKEGGFTQFKYKGTRNVDELIKFIQPSPFSQEMLIFLDRTKGDQSDAMGIQSRTVGHSYAADSGVKMDVTDEMVIRYHAPSFKIESFAMKNFGVQWKSNYQQFDKEEKTYSVISREGKPKAKKFAGISMRMQYPAKVVIHVLETSQRDAMLAKLMELKSAGTQVPDVVLYKYCGVPELAEYATIEGKNKQQAMMLMEQIQASGLMEDVIQLMEKRALEEQNEQ